MARILQMKGLLLFLLAAGPGFVLAQQVEPMEEVVGQALAFAKEQSLRMAARYKDSTGVLPQTFENGKMVTSGPEWWCSGFFPGTLWYLYEYGKDDRLLAHAREYTARVEGEQFTMDNHDVGFMLYCSFGNGYRLTGDPHYRDVLLTGAASLATRFDRRLGLVRSWDWNAHRWQFPVIIDNMMNLELLSWASRASGDQDFRQIAVSHADRTLLHHFRPDESSYHVVSYDTASGKPHLRETYQGHADESSWARGQAWALYGYVMMYRETLQPRYLGQALKITDFLMNHPRMPTDFIPYWDFDAPGIPDTFRDASSGALMASAWLELSRYVTDALSRKLVETAGLQLRTLASADYTAKPGENGNFILKHSVGFLPQHSEVDVPLTYADYYYVEALMRYKTLKGF